MHGELRILIVEDNPIVQMQYRIYFTEQGFDTTCAGSLREATDILMQDVKAFDVALLDNQLEDGEGIRLASLIKAKMIYCAVLVVSANTDPEFLIHAFEEGIDDYIIKPANMELLGLKVKSNTERLALKRLADQQSKALRVWKDNAQHEQELASHLLEAMFNNVNQVSPAINAWIRPSELFSGDAVMQCQCLDGNIYVLLADAMGHGLAAAVSLMPLMQAFKAMATKGLPLANVIFEANKKLVQMTPEGRFVAAVAMKIIPRVRQIELWNGGLPAALLVGADNSIVQTFPSENMPLGILGDSDFSPHPVLFNYSDDNKLLFFTDGLIETPNREDQFLDAADVIRLVVENTDDGLSELKSYVARNLRKPEDDISVCLIECHKLNKQLADADITFDHVALNGDVKCSYELSGDAVKTVDLPGLISSLLSEHELPLQLVQRAFTVVTELLVNALEHGVLRLDSNLKNTDDGFLNFYSEKEQRLRNLSAADVIKLSMDWDSSNRKLKFQIEDSGAGFPFDDKVLGSDEKIFGRGIALIKQLTSSFEVIPPGNTFRVVLSE